MRYIIAFILLTGIATAQESYDFREPERCWRFEAGAYQVGDSSDIFTAQTNVLITRISVSADTVWDYSTTLDFSRNGNVFATFTTSGISEGKYLSILTDEPLYQGETLRVIYGTVGVGDGHVRCRIYYLNTE